VQQLHVVKGKGGLLEMAEVQDWRGRWRGLMSRAWRCGPPFVHADSFVDTAVPALRLLLAALLILLGWLPISFLPSFRASSLTLMRRRLQLVQPLLVFLCGLRTIDVVCAIASLTCVPAFRRRYVPADVIVAGSWPQTMLPWSIDACYASTIFPLKTRPIHCGTPRLNRATPLFLFCKRSAWQTRIP
jgi:hypothetical protein